MSIISENELSKKLIPQAGDLNPDIAEENIDQERGFTSGFSREFERGNTIGSALSNDFQELNTGEIDPTVNMRDLVPAGYENRAVAFARANTAEDVTRIVTQLDREERLLQESANVDFFSTEMLGQMSAWALDPINLIPGGAVVKSVKAGKRVLQGAAISAAAGASAGTILETTLQGTQRARELEESALNIASMTVLGGLFGGTISGIAGGKRAKMQERLKQTIAGKFKEEDIAGSGVGSASAKQAIDPEDTVLTSRTKAAIKITQPGFLKSTSARGLMSESPSLRNFTDEMFDHNFKIGRVEKGIGREHQEILSQLDGVEINNVQVESDNLFLKSLGIDASASGRSIKGTIKGKTQQDLPYKTISEFYEEVGDTINSGIPHKVKEVNEAAKLIQEKLLVKWGGELKTRGILDEGVDVSSDSNFLSRVWVKDKIVADLPNFRNMMARNLRKQSTKDIRKLADDLADEAENLSGSKRRAIATRLAKKEALDDSDFLEIADELTDTLTGLGDESIQLQAASGLAVTGKKARFTKERMLRFLPYEDIKPYINRNAMDGASAYAYQSSLISRYQDGLNNIGVDNLEELLQIIKDEHKIRLNAATTAKGRAKIQKQLEADLEHATVASQILLGTWTKSLGKKFDTGLELLKQYQVMRLMGGVTLASIPDLGMFPFRFGGAETMINGIRPMLKSLKNSKAAKDDLQDFVIANQLSGADILRAQMSGEFRAGRPLSKTEKVSEGFSRGFSKVNLMAYWNQHVNRMAAHMSAAKIIRLLRTDKAGKALKQDEIELLATAGIDMRLRDRILSQPFEEVDGSIISHHKHWKDAEAKQNFAQAIRQLSNNAPLQPGKGDLPPIFTQNKLAQALVQFKSFVAAVSNRIVVPAIERADQNVLMGAVVMMALANISGYTRTELVNGQKYDTGLTNLLVQGGQRSGLVPLLADGVFTAAGAMGIGPGGKGARFGDRSVTGFIGGPSLHLPQDLLSMIARTSQKGLDATAIRQMTSFLPYQNVFYLRMLLERTGK